jgi:hypothetical protein
MGLQLGGEMASALDGPSAWGDSGILGFWDSGILGLWDSGTLGFWAVQSKRPSRRSARPQLFSPFGGRRADWRWPGDQLRCTFSLEADDVEKHWH